MTSPICSTYSSPSVSIIQQDSPIGRLPDDVFIDISKYLNVKDLLSWRSTCIHLYKVLQDNMVWIHRFSSDFPEINKKFNNYLSAYKLLYSHRARRVETPFNEDQVTLAVFNDTLTSASYDTATKLWNLNNSKERITTLPEHESLVTALAVSPRTRTLFSGSCDGMINVLDLDSKKCTATLWGYEGHKCQVSSFTVLGDTLFSGSWEGTFKIWDLASKKCNATLSLCEKAVDPGPFSFPVSNSGLSFAVLDSSTLCSGTRNKEAIRVWNLDSKECIASLQGHELGIYSLVVLDSSTLISGSCDGTIKVWDLPSKECVATLQGHELGHELGIYYSLVVLDSNTLISGSSDRTIKVWDLKSKKCIATLQGHEHRVNSLAVLDKDSNTLISGSMDKTIKIWDLKSKKCIASQTGEHEIYSLATLQGKLIFNYGKEIKVCDFTDDFPLRKTLWT